MSNDLFVPPASSAPAGTTESPTDPNFGWHGPDTDIRHRKPLSNEELEAIRKRAQTAAPPGFRGDDVRRMQYDAGIGSSEMPRRICALEAQVFLLTAQIEALQNQLKEKV